MKMIHLFSYKAIDNTQNTANEKTDKSMETQIYLEWLALP